VICELQDFQSCA